VLTGALKEEIKPGKVAKKWVRQSPQPVKTSFWVGKANNGANKPIHGNNYP